MGATVIEMGTGKPPWPEFRNNLAALFHVATSTTPPTPPEHLSDACKTFLGRCFCIDPMERPGAHALLTSDPFVYRADDVSAAPSTRTTARGSGREEPAQERGQSDHIHMVPSPREEVGAGEAKARTAYEHSVQASGGSGGEMFPSV